MNNRNTRQPDKTLIIALVVVGVLSTFFCIISFVDFPKITRPTATPRPTLDVRTLDLKNSLLSSDDFVNYCCGDSYYVKLGNQHDGLPSEEFIGRLEFTSKNLHRFDDFGKPIRTFTYEIIDSFADDYVPEGYLVAFIYSSANDAKNIYGGGGKELPDFDLASFLDGFPDDWAYGRFLRCRVIGKIFIDDFTGDNLTYLSRDISSRMGYLC
jgi:hypothetical protein